MIRCQPCEMVSHLFRICLGDELIYVVVVMCEYTITVQKSWFYNFLWIGKPPRTTHSNPRGETTESISYALFLLQLLQPGF